MSWDPGLLRKYSSTNHYKLLNQVRNDLKEQPIQRGPGTSARRGGGGARRRQPAPTPVAQPVALEASPSNSYDAFVAVPVLIESFE